MGYRYGIGGAKRKISVEKQRPGHRQDILVKVIFIYVSFLEDGKQFLVKDTTWE